MCRRKRRKSVLFGKTKDDSKDIPAAVTYTKQGSVALNGVANTTESK